MTTSLTIYYSKAYDSRKCEFKANRRDYVYDSVNNAYGPGSFTPTTETSKVSDAVKNFEYMLQDSAPILDVSDFATDPTIEDYMRGIDGGIHVQLNDASDADPLNHTALGCCTLYKVPSKKANRYIKDYVKVITENSVTPP